MQTWLTFFEFFPGASEPSAGGGGVKQPFRALIGVGF